MLSSYTNITNWLVIVIILLLFQANSILYGIDWNGPLPDDDDVEVVEVTSTANPLSERDFIQLQSTVSPIDNSDCQGVDLYIRTLEFVRQKLTG